jgi:guanylate kinase
MSTAFLFVVSAPSGAGKSTLCRALMERWPNLYYSVSCTTRKPRPGETPGKDYIFLTETDFRRRIQDNQFLEWAKVHDHYYGTLRQPIEEKLRQGVDVLLDVDPQGATALKESFSNTVCVFLAPPSFSALERRLRHRAQDDEATISKRLANAREEIRQIRHYDYLVVNEVKEEAIEDLSAIFRAEHRRLARLSDDIPLLKTLQNTQKE